jgi:hypothetical protein
LDFQIGLFLSQHVSGSYFGAWQYPLCVATLKLHALLFCRVCLQYIINYPKAAAFKGEPLWLINKASILSGRTTTWVISNRLGYHGCGGSVEIAVTKGSRSLEWVTCREFCILIISSYVICLVSKHVQVQQRTQWMYVLWANNGTCSYTKRRAQSKNMWEQNDEKNICDRQIHNFHCFDDLIYKDSMLDFGRKIQK